MTASVAVATLRAELDRHAAEGRRIGWWWRDDDAVADGPELSRLLALSRSERMPISLAVIPALAEPSLSERLRHEDGVTVLVHGWRHVNHAAAGEKPAEFECHRPLRAMAQEASAALGAIEAAFGPRCLPVFTPPWNRIAPDVAARLPDLGYRGLSCFGEPAHAEPLVRVDTHLDPVDWRGSRSLVVPDAIVTMMRHALRCGAGTIGLLTHHLMFDETLWAFCEGVVELCGDHPAIRPLGLDALLATTAAKGGAPCLVEASA